MKHPSDPSWTPLNDAFSVIWDHAYLAGMARGYDAVVDKKVFDVGIAAVGNITGVIHMT